jgi:protein-S-isoprenylcysteine O-methyltransferase Ste14
LKVPPPVVAAVLALLMWGVAGVTGSVQVSDLFRFGTALSLFLAGFALRAVAQLTFLKSRTTINPVDPSNSSSLVNGGIYRLSRNPMYLGRVLELAGWAAFLCNVVAALLVPLYVLYISRFQIQPEERALLARFGEQYAAYQREVRRWL